MDELFEFQTRCAETGIDYGAQSCSAKLLENTTRASDKVPSKICLGNATLSNLFIDSSTKCKEFAYPELPPPLSNPAIKPELRTHSDIG